jgi:hypothetical protein
MGRSSTHTRKVFLKGRRGGRGERGGGVFGMEREGSEMEEDATTPRVGAARDLADEGREQTADSTENRWNEESPERERTATSPGTGTTGAPEVEARLATTWAQPPVPSSSPQQFATTSLPLTLAHTVALMTPLPLTPPIPLTLEYALTVALTGAG